MDSTILIHYILPFIGALGISIILTILIRAIAIKLNIDDDKLKNLFGGNGSDDALPAKKCDTWLSKEISAVPVDGVSVLSATLLAVPVFMS